MVKYGRHSPTYDLHPHIGGRHSVLYFTIQATEKYSNSDVLVGGMVWYAGKWGKYPSPNGGILHQMTDDTTRGSFDR